MSARASAQTNFDSEYFRRQYPGRRLGNRMRARYWARWLERRVPRSGLILEVGSGLGDFASACRLPLVVSDISPDVLARCNGRRFIHTCASVLSLPFPADRFDAVVVLDVLEHVDSPTSALSEIARVLAPGGRVIVSVPNTRGLGGRLKRGHSQLVWFGDSDPTHKQLLPPEEWVDLIRHHGLRIARMGSDAPWDAPYPLPIPRWVQRFLCTVASALVVRVVGMLPWSIGENLVLVAAKPCASFT